MGHNDLLQHSLSWHICVHLFDHNCQCLLVNYGHSLLNSYQQLHMSTCKSDSTICLLLATEALATINQNVARGLIKLLFSTLGCLSHFDGPNHQLSALSGVAPHSVKGWIIFAILICNQTLIAIVVYF